MRIPWVEPVETHAGAGFDKLNQRWSTSPGGAGFDKLNQRWSGIVDADTVG
jgi:hypothetical protein